MIKKDIPKQYIWIDRAWHEITIKVERFLLSESRIYQIDGIVEYDEIETLAKFVLKYNIYLDISGPNVMDVYDLPLKNMMLSLEKYNLYTCRSIVSTRFRPAYFLEKMSILLRNYMILCYELPGFRYFSEFDTRVCYL